MRFNIIFAMGQLSKHNSVVKINHMKIAKKMINYLKGIIYLKFIYGTQAKNKREIKV